MLNTEQQDLWDAYLRVEARGSREQKLSSLEQFLAKLEPSPMDEWADWARSIAERCVDNSEDFQIRMPLFRRAIFPVLLAGLQQKRTGYARWLAGLSQQLYGCKECRDQLPDDMQTEIGLLHAAIQHDPNDSESRLKMLQAWAWQLDYTVHEVPAGVLHGNDGATPAQCLELQEWLDEFVELATTQNQVERYRHLIEKCRLHFWAYHEYLISQNQFGSYRDYLEKRPSNHV